MSVKREPSESCERLPASHHQFKRLKLQPAEILDIDVGPVLLTRELRNSPYLRSVITLCLQLEDR